MSNNSEATRLDDLKEFASRWRTIERQLNEVQSSSLDWYLEQTQLIAPLLGSDLPAMQMLSGPEFFAKVRKAQKDIAERGRSSATKKPPVHPADHLHLEGAATVAAWGIPYSGSAHELLRQAIEDASAVGRGAYTRFFAIVQSSGMGKSRAVDEVAKRMFTIPFNIREKESGKAYPLPDHNVRNHFTNFPIKTRLGTSVDFLVFFTCLFEVVSDRLDNHRDWGHDLPKLWYNFLKEPSPVDPGKNNRELIYDETCASTKEVYKVIQREVDRMKDEEREKDKGASLADEVMFRKAVSPRAKGALNHLASIIKSFGLPQHDNIPSVLMYFDECHILSSRQCETDGDDWGNCFDALCSALNILDERQIFTVFLSTNSSVERHAPAARNLPSARAGLPGSHAPFTELPFDCHPEFPIYEGLRPREYWRPLTIDKICRLPFLCSFGRPMFWTRLEKLDDMIKENVVSFAMLKLRGQANQEAFSPINTQRLPETNSDSLTDRGTARLAVLDIRLLLDFEAHRQPIHTLMESKLVESHMRVAFSVPAHREYCISGYPSEPILAEAAKRLMRSLCTQDSDVIASILMDHVDNGLISKGERGEMVARLLLTLAYDKADQRYNAGSPLFSNPVPVIDFLEALTGEHHWGTIKAAKPDNLPNGATLAEAFRNAKVRFTHFNRAWDDSGCTSLSAMAAFLRAMGIQCHPTKEGIDIILPVFFDSPHPNDPHEILLKHISGILISVKNRQKASARQKVRVDAMDIDFFPSTSPEHDEAPRPYIVIVMELGAQPPTSKMQPSTHNPAKRTTSERDDMDQDDDSRKRSRTRDTTPTSVHPPQDVLMTPSNIETEKGPTRRSSRKTNPHLHPRYTIYVQGCSPSVYPVINNRDLYARLLGSRKLLVEHPRPGARFLSGLWSLKPGWSFQAAKECYQWFNGTPYDEEMKVLEEGVLVGQDELDE